MGLKDLFTGFTSRSSEKVLAKNVARLTNQNVQHEDRLRAAEVLAELNTEEAIYGLLKRYEMTLEKGYMDQDEKVYVRDLIVDKGEAALGPIRRFLKDSDAVNWPERILSNILNDDARVVGVLLEVIEEERDSGDMKGQKRAKLLSLFTKYEDPRIAPVLVTFLKDFDETARFTAVEVLDKQADASCAEALVEVMVGPDEESGRVRHRALEAFVHNGWSVAPWRDRVAAWLPPEFQIRGDKIFEA